MKKVRIPKERVRKKVIKGIEYLTFTHYDRGNTKQFYGRDIKQLEEKYNKWLNEVRELPANNIGDLYTIFLKEKEITVKPNTYKSYYQIYINHVKNSNFSRLSLKEIDSYTILKFLDSLELKFSSKQLVLTHLKTFFKFLINRGLLDKSPCGGISLRSDLIEEEKEKYIPLDIRTLILENCPQNQYLYIYLMEKYALRLSESLGVTKNSIKGNWLIIDRQLNYVNGKDTITTTKNKYSSRKIPVDDETVELINGWNFNNRPSRFAIQKYLAKYTVHAHLFRSSRITDWVQEGININAIKRVVGHSVASNVLEKNYLQIQENFILEEFNK